MVLTKSDKRELNALRRIIRGTPIKVKPNDVGNVRIYGGGFKPIWKQLGGNVGLSATTVTKARVQVWKKTKKNKRPMVKATGWKKIRSDNDEIIYKSKTARGFKTIGMFKLKKGALAGRWWTYFQTDSGSARPTGFHVNALRGTTRAIGFRFMTNYMKVHR